MVTLVSISPPQAAADGCTATPDVWQTQPWPAEGASGEVRLCSLEAEAAGRWSFVRFEFVVEMDASGIVTRKNCDSAANPTRGVEIDDDCVEYDWQDKESSSWYGHRKIISAVAYFEQSSGTGPPLYDTQTGRIIYDSNSGRIVCQG